MQRWLVHNLGLKLVALGLAALLWMVVVGEQKVELVVEVPMTLPIPPRFMVVNNPPDMLQVRLRGPKGLISSLRTREIHPAEPASVLTEGENTIPLGEDLIRVPRGIQVIDVAPRRIRIVLEPIVEREIEVTSRLDGTLPDGLSVRRVTAVPDRVRIVGPASEVRRATRLQTYPVSLNGRRASFAAPAQLEPIGTRTHVEGSETVTVEVEVGKRS